MRYLLALLIALIYTSLATAADWPAFRGRQGNGISEEKTAPLEWSKTTNVKWSVALPQAGNGSPIVSNGKVFVTCAEDGKGHDRAVL